MPCDDRAGFVVLPGTRSATVTWGLESDDGSTLSIGGSPSVSIDNAGERMAVR